MKHLLLWLYIALLVGFTLLWLVATSRAKVFERWLREARAETAERDRLIASLRQELAEQAAARREAEQRLN